MYNPHVLFEYRLLVVISTYSKKYSYPEQPAFLTPILMDLFPSSFLSRLERSMKLPHQKIEAAQD